MESGLRKFDLIFFETKERMIEDLDGIACQGRVLLYHAHKGEIVRVLGRTDMDSDAVHASLLAFIIARDAFANIREIDRADRINTVFFEHRTALLAQLNLPAIHYRKLVDPQQTIEATYFRLLEEIISYLGELKSYGCFTIEIGIPCGDFFRLDDDWIQSLSTDDSTLWRYPVKFKDLLL